MTRKIEIWNGTQTDPNKEGGWVRHAGGADAPQCHEVHTGPNDRQTVHAHIEDEIIYIIAGEMIFGPNTLGPGSSVYVPGNTLYSFVAGPQGVHYVNFRPRADRTNFSREEFATLKTLEGGDREAYIKQNVAANLARYAKT